MRDFNRSRGGNRGGGGGYRGGGGGGQRFGGDRQMHPAVCSNCGKDCEVPFKPTGEKPVFCHDCFRKDSGDSQPRGRGRDYREDRAPRAEQPNYQFQFDGINKKLAEIMAVLETLAPTPVEAPVEPKPKKKPAPKKKDLKAPSVLKKSPPKKE